MQGSFPLYINISALTDGRHKSKLFLDLSKFIPDIFNLTI